MHIFTRKNGKKVTLLNPSERGKKFAAELKDGHMYTNSGKLKVDEDGPIPLSDTQRAFRSGYLSAQKDSANAWKAKQKKK